MCEYSRVCVCVCVCVRALTVGRSKRGGVYGGHNKGLNER